MPRVAKTRAAWLSRLPVFPAVALLSQSQSRHAEAWWVRLSALFPELGTVRLFSRSLFRGSRRVHREGTRHLCSKHLFRARYRGISGATYSCLREEDCRNREKVEDGEIVGRSLVEQGLVNRTKSIWSILMKLLFSEKRACVSLMDRRSPLRI